MLDGLHLEHLNIAKLLDVLRDKLFAIRSEKPIHYRLLKDILCYLSEVADQRHHPQEDLIYDYYLKYRFVITSYSIHYTKLYEPRSPLMPICLTSCSNCSGAWGSRRRST